MSEFSPDEEMDLGMAGFLEAMRKGAHMSQRVSELCDKENDEVEKAILMTLWQKLGDQTETYWEAMQAVHAFVKAIRKVRGVLEGFPGPMKATIFETLAQIFLSDVSTIRKIELLKMEVQNGAPPKDIHNGGQGS